MRRDGDSFAAPLCENVGWARDRTKSLAVAESEIRSAWKSAAPDVRKSLRAAAANIRRFCEWQKPVAWTRSRRGISVGQFVRPLDSVGCYVPGGRYPLVSTLLMTVIPAQVAGVENIRVVSPKPSAEVLAAAAMLGIREFYRVGGAQAIAALAYGTKTIPRVDKIVGPGNAYVTVCQEAGLVRLLDRLPGWSDRGSWSSANPAIPIHRRRSGRAGRTRSRCLVHLHHDAFSARRSRSASTFDELAARTPIARKSLQRQGAILVATSREQARDWANALAPEHITVDSEDLPTFAMPARSSSETTLRKPPAIMPPVPTTFCPPPGSPIPRRSKRPRFREAHHRAEAARDGLTADRTDRRISRADSKDSRRTPTSISVRCAHA